MMKRTAMLVCILMLITGACAPSRSSISEPTTTVIPTLTASPTRTPTPAISPTDTPTPTVDLRPFETQLPVAILTFSAPVVIVPPTRRAIRTRMPTDTPTSTATAELPPSETPHPTLTPTLSCERETASVLLSVSAESLKVGDTVKVTVTVNNEGCVALGLPQYRLYIESDGPQSIFTPENPEPVVHSLAVVPGQFDSAEFDLTAITSGQATLTASVSYEVHLGYPGPAYWGYASTREPLGITVVP